MPISLVSPDWVREHREGSVVVDVRRPWEYDEDGHVPGAVNVPFERFRDPAAPTPGQLPTATAFGALLGDAGIGPRDRIVAYDGAFGVAASRFLLTAAVFGHDPDRLFLLDGDIERWRRDHECSWTTPPVDTTDYDCAMGAETPLVSADDLDAALDSDAVVVDTRDGREYETVHVPGAVNLQWRALVDGSERRLLSADRLDAVLADHGLAPGRPVRLYCNTARRLSFVYAVLRHLGYDDVGVYEGGIDAWADYGGPVATGP